MDREAELAIVRRAYAKQILAVVKGGDGRLREAFSAVPREDFLGPGPWQAFRFRQTGSLTPEADPVYLYVDQVFALVPERGINNGQPSLHAALLASANIQQGDHVVHVGAGTGYFSAIMAHLAGPSGRVTAFEIDSALAARARQCLAGYSNVTVIEGNGGTLPFDAADVIYVNAGVTHPQNQWLDGLTDGGRLLLPLTTDDNLPSAMSVAFDPLKVGRTGAYFRIQRQGVAFAARFLLPTAIIPAEGLREAVAEAALAAAFQKGGWNTVTRLIRGDTAPEVPCWLRAPGWCLG
jgi:protein-L-isoaspartate(D-aspartate) O-methyltransferase